ncbi:hypothetical protein OKW98_24540 [Pseudomonas sp. KU26590]|uniref:hypothetical protein n=1 Tax=Pseudomonas sp. KU26590 TaxID=2991051 RepID=UPI00223E86E7|nr:hypothetical protein [Pseudomonas sp. KU26590]UZJ59675.1 hypothetical protein OKW98_24540 [Pseudomonas sp. KU26590]
MLRGPRAPPVFLDRLPFRSFHDHPEHTPAPDARESHASVDANAAAADTKPAIPAFSFPFKSGELLQAKKDQQHYKGPGKSNHDKRPGAAPSGTRRSMGKR